MNKETLLGKLPYDRIKINWNKKPIPMDLFLSFLTIPTEISRNHLGRYNGWTQRFNKEHELIIRGGIVGGVNYLDCIEYKKKLNNPYNNYVNPFYLFDIMNNEGKIYFLDYYEYDIEKELKEQSDKVAFHASKVTIEQNKLNAYLKEIKDINK